MGERPVATHPSRLPPGTDPAPFRAKPRKKLDRADGGQATAWHRHQLSLGNGVSGVPQAVPPSPTCATPLPTWETLPAVESASCTEGSGHHSGGRSGSPSHPLHPRFGQLYQPSLTPQYPTPCTSGWGCLPHILLLPGRYFLLLPPRIPLPPSPFSVSLISTNGKWAPSRLGKLPGGCRPGTGYKLPLESLRRGGGWSPVVLHLSVPRQQSSASAREPCQASAIPGPVPFSLLRDRGLSAPLMPRRGVFSISAHHLIINLRHRDGRGITDRRMEGWVPAKHLSTASLPCASEYLKLGAEAHSSARQARLTVA